MARTFFKYAIPSVVAMWVFSIYTMVDGYFVAYAVGPMALASVNIAMPFINLIFGVSILCSIGASAIASIYLGKKDLEKARSSFMTNLVFLTALALFITGFCLLFIDKISLMLGATPNLFDNVKSYLSIIVGFVFFFIVSYYLEVMARADGFPKLATAGVIVAALTNIVLDYLFVVKFGWGIKGAAWATGIAQVFSTIMLGLHFFGKKTKLQIAPFSFSFDYIKRGLGLGLADSVTEFSVGVAIFLFNIRILHIIGEEGVVGYTVISYVTTLVVMTMCGISQGMQPLMSFYHGRNDTAACKALLKLSLATGAIASFSWFAIAEILAAPFISLFVNVTENAGIHASAVSAFRLYAISYLFVGVNVILSTFFSSIEKPKYGITLSLSRGLFVIAISLYILSEIFGAPGIWLSPTLSEVLCLAIGAAALYRLTGEQRKPLPAADVA